MLGKLGVYFLIFVSRMGFFVAQNTSHFIP